MNRIIYLLFYFVLGVSISIAQNSPLDSEAEQKKVQPTLFQDNAIIKVVLKGNFKEILDDRGDERDYHPALFEYEGKDGESISVGIKTKVRGNFRRNRKNCDFPPLRLNFSSKNTAGTLFEGQDKLKLVTPCQSKRSAYQQYIIQEYLVYKAYNELTEKSFKVRLVEITYEDSSAKYKPLTKYGFLIEDQDLMAERLGGRIIESKSIHPLKAERNTTLLMTLFQYMVANTDWSISGLHNVRMLMIENDQPPIPIPYDFDWSGVVNPPYAVPNPKLELASVKDRLYRGFMRPQEEFDQAIAHFNTQKEAIISVYKECDLLTPKEQQKSITFIEEFYEIINNPKKFKRFILIDCRQ